MAIPVIMYHSVLPQNIRINNDWLVTDLKLFEKQLKYLKNEGYHTIDLLELYKYRFYGTKIEKKSIVLTFDDGYLDNWVFVYPLLKKYGFKGTIFINPHFIQEGKKRINFEQVNYLKKKAELLNSIGYLNWEEISYMDKSPFIDIQSHSMTHTWYFKSEKIIDILKPQNEKKYYWYFWNVALKSLAVKWMELNNFEKELKKYYGYPIFEHGKSLEVRRFFSSKEIEKISSKMYIKGIKISYILNKLNSLNICKGHYETVTEMRKRYTYELRESKRILESKLRKKINFLCWPGGAKNSYSINIAKKYYLCYIQNEKQNGIYNYNLKLDRSLIINRFPDNHKWDSKIGLVFFKINLFIHQFHQSNLIKITLYIKNKIQSFWKGII